MSSPSVEERSPGELGIDVDALARFVDATGALAIVDLETTGLPDDPAAEILEFGAVLVDPGARTITTIESLVCPRGTIPLAIQHLTGLTDADVVGAPRIGEFAATITSLLAGRTLVAHNADFERSFLSRFVSSALAESDYLDTQDLLSITHPDSPDLRLATFSRELLAREERHRALSDALDALGVMSAVAVGVRSGERRYAIARMALENYASESPWLPLLVGDTLTALDSPPSQYAALDPTGEAPVPFDEDRIAEVLSDAERGRRYFPNYRVRSQQIELARHFVRTLNSGGRLLLEGGTGVGKSLAYLAAAIPYAMERAARGEREPVVISTRTKLLQDQLLNKDIPAAAALLGYPDLKALSIKGRANYVCSRRLAVVLSEGREPRIFAEDRLAYAALAACAGIRRHGEVGKLPGGLLYRYPPLRQLVRQSVATRAEQCTREQCAIERDCPFGQRRAALAGANLVVANHDLLLLWPPDYPNFVDAIIDEAHELAGVVDEAFAIVVRPPDVLERIDELFGRSADGRRGAGLLGRGSFLEDGSSGGISSEPEDVRSWRRGLEQDFVALGRYLAKGASEFGEIQLPAYADRIFPEAAELALMAAERVRAAADSADRIASARGKDEEEMLVISRLISELRDAADALGGAFVEGDLDAVAAFEDLAPPFDRWRLVVRAVAPADAFHERFAQKLRTLSCVSASLFIDNDPFAAVGELELERHGEPRVEHVTVESPFPYHRHTRVVAMNEAGDLVVQTAEVLAELARLLSGRTLGLFTSLRRMRDVRDLLSELLRGEGYEILMPRRATDDPATLVERFARSGGRGVLLGARTFWQGLDIPGSALQAVVIEKLPFEVPTELRRRREARIEAAGESSFERYTMGKMLLNLKQMSGRLIRAEDDRGLVAIVEGRTERRYFGRLREAFPSGCEVEVAGRSNLAEMLRQVGISPSESPATGVQVSSAWGSTKGPES